MLVAPRVLTLPHVPVVPVVVVVTPVVVGPAVLRLLAEAIAHVAYGLRQSLTNTVCHCLGPGGATGIASAGLCWVGGATGITSPERAGLGGLVGVGVTAAPPR